MPTPTNRTTVRVAGGTYSNLNSSVSDIQEGEICYATDQDKLYVKEGSSLVDASTTDISAKADIASPTFTGTPAAPTATAGTNTTQIATTEFVTTATSGKADTSDIGTTIQAYDAQTAKTDVAQLFTAAQRGSISTLSAGQGSTNIGLNANIANNFVLLMQDNYSFANPNALVAGQSGSIFIVQDSTGGRTLSWGPYWDWPGGVAPTLSTAANAVDRVDYIVRSTTSVHAVFTGNYS